MKKKRFIVCVDLSDYSKNLITYAADWANTSSAEIVILHQTITIIPALTDLDSREVITQNRNDEVLQILKKIVKDKTPNNLSVTYIVNDLPIQETLTLLLDEPFDHLVFVGLKGTGLLKKIFIGSVALKIINHCSVPVVAMPKEITSFNHKTIFISVSTPPLNLIELNKLLNYIDAKETTLTFFSLSTSDNEDKISENKVNDYAEFFREKYVTHSEIFEGTQSLDNIKMVINNRIEEILIVQKNSHLLTDRFFKKFIINELVYEGQTPLIVLP